VQSFGTTRNYVAHLVQYKIGPTGSRILYKTLHKTTYAYVSEWMIYEALLEELRS
jgi:hypothetical protein